ncbi:hypothetical protein [Streptomyces chromofuscus]|uniref:Uncharacterized protein n=1 Tax=Streptomyces chromofuscus TaxID=42881 RepID=A0A7M2TFV0_STRCW|nr:hypothetical protein [Streptomyces chromofuscus]QOV46805.1 hypothetical protein IPT68_13500 [Streptomyces chromofuscus]GGT13655.1 hypothetical protein GCM10010254_37710 [Streptomyces chromofuscus]
MRLGTERPPRSPGSGSGFTNSGGSLTDSSSFECDRNPFIDHPEWVEAIW